MFRLLAVFIRSFLRHPTTSNRTTLLRRIDRIRDNYIAELLSDVWHLLPSEVFTVLATRFNGGAIEEIDTPVINFLALAHTTSKRGNHWSILVNKYVLQRLNRNDIRFVLAHELAHVFLNHARSKAENVAVMALDEREADLHAVLWGFRPNNRRLLSDPALPAAIESVQ